MNILYPAGYKGEEVSAQAVDRAPTREQREEAKRIVDGLVHEPKDYNVLIPLLEKAMPSVFTTDEMVALFDEMNVGRKPEAKNVSATLAPEMGETNSTIPE